MSSASRTSLPAKVKRMIVSILESPDLRRPRLAFALAQVRRCQCRSLALLDATASSASQWRSTSLSTAPGSLAMVVVRAAGPCLEPVLATLKSRCRDIVIDIEETESFAAKSALVSAKVLVVALSMSDRGEPTLPVALRETIERARLFNPTLKVLLIPVCEDRVLANISRNALQRLANLIPCSRVANRSLHDLARLRSLSRGAFDAGMERDIVALCAELFPLARGWPPLALVSLPGLRKFVALLNTPRAARRAIPAGRADIPPPFQ
jgi:hypothetical protein